MRQRSGSVTEEATPQQGVCGGGLGGGEYVLLCAVCCVKHVHI